jgi:hypothetical protein
MEIDKISGLTDEAEKVIIFNEITRKNGKISERLVIPQESHYFSNGRLILIDFFEF